MVISLTLNWSARASAAKYQSGDLSNNSKVISSHSLRLEVPDHRGLGSIPRHPLGDCGQPPAHHMLTGTGLTSCTE